jgi:hypothetical protein
MVFRLVRGQGKPFLAYSPMCSIEDSSEPFRAVLGAILSVHRNLPVQTSVLSPSDDTLEEEDTGTLGEEDVGNPEEDTGPLPEGDIEDDSGPYVYSSSISTNSPHALMARFQTTASRQAAEPGLMVCPISGRFLSAGLLVYLQITSSSPHSPESFQVWVHLHPLPSNFFGLPLYAENGIKKRRLWLTRVIGSGSTGTVWQCRSDKSDYLFAIKVVELLRRADVERQKRFRNEFEVYMSLETAYHSGQLCCRITPHCYGAFKGDVIRVLILELCDATLNSWDELDIAER